MIGIGNSGRQDDGLGWAFLDRIQKLDLPLAQLEYRYQLQIEDAALISEAKSVVFVDSFDGHLPDGYAWKRCEARSDVQFTSHVLLPEAVIYLCQNLYSTRPEAYVLMIQGKSWDLETGLSETAQTNLEVALSFFQQQVSNDPLPG